ncbi:MAG: FAD-dependent monooxygenase [Rhizobiaceae bacterium]
MINLKSRTIAIVGGGIGGLTSALLLERNGFRIRLFERSKKPAATGAGIQLSPNAIKILFSLGLEKPLRLASFHPRCVDIRSGITGQKLTNFHLGNEVLIRHNAPYLVLHRADLHAILRQACSKLVNIEINEGHEITDMAAHPNGVTLIAETSHSTVEFRASGVIGADGIWSTARNFVHNATQPSFDGRIAWRALIDRKEVSDLLPKDATGLWLGPNAHLVHYPVRQGNVMNIVAVTPWQKKGEPHPNDWLSNDREEERINAFDAWLPMLQSQIRLKAKWGGWPLYTTPRCGAITNGPLCLIGDAAHPLAPYSAQGGGAAIEDAAVLANACKENPANLEAAFKAYETIRRPRINKLIKLGRNNRRIYHLSSPANWARDMIMKRTPQTLMQKRMDWLYGWEPPISSK